ncbi:40S ribosomal protein S27 [Mucor velutinosus]|uniref:40S ribosomal protein S27 n=1 Tax=Mucor velutinosus TaxID=708070 RepID=A0AAN7DAM1_9FUNG|nr:40S ribosomal protein S27 [Mucor velutinosus]
MVFNFIKKKVVSFAGATINQVCSAVFLSAASVAAAASSPAIKANQDVLPAAPVLRTYVFLKDVYRASFQLAKNAGYCIVEELSKIIVRTAYFYQLRLFVYC